MTDTGPMYPVAPPVEGRDWLSTTPVDWADLRGQVVIVLFWSSGCEASLLAVRRMEDLADRWPSTVTVLAVHTPRFPYEDDRRVVESAIARHRITLPVVHDPDYITWNRYNPGAWPAVAIVDRKGRVIGINAGTSESDLIAEVVATELAKPNSGRRSSSDGDRARNKTRATDGSNLAGSSPAGSNTGDVLDVDADRTLDVEDSTLLFPSGVATTPSGLVVIADSGHDRLLIGELDSDLRTVRPEIELTDIDNPTAVACASDSVIYVVEGGTGSVLQVDLDNGTLDILADEELAVPTALLVDGDRSLVVADAGNDQLVRIAGGSDDDLVVGPIAGCGLSGTRDGNAGQAELAQPTGLARTSSGIAFCDAASSNVRLLTDNGRVLTITGNDFFDWGLVDGPAHRARLQRPTGLCVTADGSLLIADTGNNRIRILENRRVRTLGLTGLNQPTSLAMTSTGHVLIADTGNHRLVVADPAMRTAWPLAVYPAAMTSVWDPANQG
ncbi:MAG: redoxin domain-containing protein [Acidimicrobiales bacterium]